jgi:ABC-type sugar transport system ATPase subunit
VEVSGLSKAFPGVQALDDVQLTLRAGEVHAIAGENGSGKSTLVKMLYGALTPDAGVIRVDGVPVQIPSPRRARDLGIVAITQELTLAPTLTVAENVLMGHLPMRRHRIDWHEAAVRATHTLERLGVELDPRSRVGTLPIELQQEVEVARALSAGSRVLILDEATSSLSEAATERLLATVEQLRAQGVAIALISHRLAEIFRCAQRATILRDGRYVAEVAVEDVNERELVQLMVGREIQDLYGKRRLRQGHPVLDVSGLTTADGAARAINFTVHAGEIVGIAGLVGCGKAELGLALGGATHFDGAVKVDQSIVRRRSPRAAIKAGIAYVPADRKNAGILPTRSVRHNLSIAWGDILSRFGILSVLKERRLADRTVAKYGVKTRSLDTSIIELSGGNQQKVILGRSFTRQPRVVVLDEPTRGIDVGAKSDVYQHIQDIAENGTGIVLISSELPELIGLADRILVMFRGQIVASFDSDDADEESIAHFALGGEGGVGS